MYKIDHDCSGRNTQVQYRIPIIDYKKSIIHINLQIVLNDSIPDTTISTKYEFNIISFSAVMKFQKKKK